MDINTRIQASDLEDKYRDEADESRSQLDKNINLSTASRLAAIKQGIKVTPDVKNKIMYRNINPHKIGFIGTLPSNKSFSSYRSIDTKLFGIGDTFNNIRGWVGNKANYLKGEWRNVGNRVGEMINPNAHNDYIQDLLDYYDRTGNTDLNQFFVDKGINPNNLSPMQRKALEETSQGLYQGDYRRDPNQERNYHKYNDINQALNDPTTRVNAQQWMNGVGTDKNGNKVTGLNKGLTDRNKAAIYNQMHDDYYGNSDYYNAENNLDNKDDQNAQQIKYRNAMLANQVNTYQNSVAQYQQHKAEMDRLNQLLNGNVSSLITDPGDKQAYEALNNATGLSADKQKKLNDIIAKYKLDSVNLDDPIFKRQLESQIKGHQAMMNKANSDLRSQGLTGLTDNMDPTKKTGYSGYGKGQAYKVNESGKAEFNKPGAEKVDKFTGIAKDFQGRIGEYQKKVDTLTKELNSGNLSEEKKQQLQNEINAANKTIASSKAWLSKMGITENSNLDNLQGEEKARFEAMKGRYNDNKSTANRRANEVTDVNQYRAITGEDVQTVNPNQVVNDAQQSYDSQYNVARDKAKQKYENNIHNSDDYKNEYNTWKGKNGKLVYKTITKNGKKQQVVDWDATNKKFKSEYLKNHAFNEDQFQNNFNSGKGYDAYNTLEQAKKVQNSPMQIMKDDNGNTVYGNKTAAIDTTPQPKAPYRQVQSPGYQAQSGYTQDEIKKGFYGL